jgi:acetyltransferase-like isoleucine patch superfamily enzyme
MKKIAKAILKGGLPVPGFVKPVIRAFYFLGVGVCGGLVFLKKFFWVEPVVRSLCDHVGKRLRAECLPFIRGQGRISLGDDVNLSGRSCFYLMRGMTEKPVIDIGSNVFIGHGCTLTAAKRISIGNHCLVSAGVRIQDNDGHPLDAAKRIAGEKISPEGVAPVTIQDGVWLGAKAIILKGVTIGKNAVVGTGSVVTKDVPAGTVVAGNPATVVRRLTVQDD